MMRRLAPPILLLAACASPPPAQTCPADEAEVVSGGSCDVAAAVTCVHHGTHYCGEGWDGLYRCSCVGGAWACEDVYPTEGEACDWAEGTSCNREGNPDCVTMPTAGSCACTGGRWTCSELCWHDCPAHWDASWTQSPPACSDEGEHCDLPGGHACACTAGHLACQ
ncbi:MAG TPA: hypothetical protein VHE35_17180 [Kofleriaceae bacterium]|nr:hypothetical protein [Kofleriaceae bacterium]